MSKMNRILKNTLTVGAFTSLSRVLGLVREMLQSRFIGAGIEQSAFTLAFALIAL
jgi:peptidoglycan biosynthesis protein MviN/MurJ (putative lipid II flippase)